MARGGVSSGGSSASALVLSSSSSADRDQSSQSTQSPRMIDVTVEDGDNRMQIGGDEGSESASSSSAVAVDGGMMDTLHSFVGDIGDLEGEGDDDNENDD